MIWYNGREPHFHLVVLFRGKKHGPEIIHDTRLISERFWLNNKLFGRYHVPKFKRTEWYLEGKEVSQKEFENFVSHCKLKEIMRSTGLMLDLAKIILEIPSEEDFLFYDYEECWKEMKLKRERGN